MRKLEVECSTLQIEKAQVLQQAAGLAATVAQRDAEIRSLVAERDNLLRLQHESPSAVKLLKDEVRDLNSKLGVLELVADLAYKQVEELQKVNGRLVATQKQFHTLAQASATTENVPTRNCNGSTTATAAVGDHRLSRPAGSQLTAETGTSPSQAVAADALDRTRLNMHAFNMSSAMVGIADEAHRVADCWVQNQAGLRDALLSSPGVLHAWLVADRLYLRLSNKAMIDVFEQHPQMPQVHICEQMAMSRISPTKEFIIWLVNSSDRPAFRWCVPTAAVRRDRGPNTERGMHFVSMFSAQDTAHMLKTWIAEGKNDKIRDRRNDCLEFVTWDEAKPEGTSAADSKDSRWVIMAPDEAIEKAASNDHPDVMDKAEGNDEAQNKALLGMKLDQDEKRGVLHSMSQSDMNANVSTGLRSKIRGPAILTIDDDDDGGGTHLHADHPHSDRELETKIEAKQEMIAPRSNLRTIIKLDADADGNERAIVFSNERATLPIADIKLKPDDGNRPGSKRMRMSSET